MAKLFLHFSASTSCKCQPVDILLMQHLCRHHWCQSIFHLIWPLYTSTVQVYKARGGSQAIHLKSIFLYVYTSSKHIRAGLRQRWGNPCQHCTAPVNILLPHLKFPRLINTLLTEFENELSSDLPSLFFIVTKSSLSSVFLRQLWCELTPLEYVLEYGTRCMEKPFALQCRPGGTLGVLSRFFSDVMCLCWLKLTHTHTLTQKWASEVRFHHRHAVSPTGAFSPPSFSHIWTLGICRLVKDLSHDFLSVLSLLLYLRNCQAWQELIHCVRNVFRYTLLYARPMSTCRSVIL